MSHAYLESLLGYHQEHQVQRPVVQELTQQQQNQAVQQAAGETSTSAEVKVRFIDSPESIPYYGD